VGPRPLVEDNSVRGAGSTTVNGRLSWRIRKGMRLEAEVFNLTDRRSSAAEYFYDSRLQGESAAHGDVHFHPIEPRSLRLSLAMQL
jgi:outer membrane receptor protein involved in Fe transport